MNAGEHEDAYEHYAVVAESQLTGLEDVTEDDASYAAVGVATVCGGWEQKHNTISLAKRALAEGVPGDLVECGVCAGTHPALMAYVLDRYGGGDRKVHLFDSFEKGFTEELVNSADDLARYSPSQLARCLPSARDPVMTSVRQVEDNMRSWRVNADRLVYHAGWVQETLPPIIATFPQIALLRVDVDLYSPTAAIFQHLYDRVSPGGYIISDDWGEYALDHPEPTGARLAALNFFDARRIAHPQVTRVACGTVWWRKP